MRTDYNVPRYDHQIFNDFRIKSSLLTINNILSKDPFNIILGTHLGRPSGKPNYDLTLFPIYEYLQKFYPEKVVFLDDPINNNIITKINSMEGKIILLENLRFHPEE